MTDRARSSPVSVTTKWYDSALLPCFSSTRPDTEVVVSKLKSKSKKKVVRVAEERNEVFEIPRIADMSEEDHYLLYYSRDEYEDIAESFEFALFLLSEGLPVDPYDQEVTTRGLEFRTKKGSRERYVIRQEAFEAVMQVQDRQWEDGVEDEDEIALTYKPHSLRSAKEAAVRGAQDEKDAM